jgi:hypothetical protein
MRNSGQKTSPNIILISELKKLLKELVKNLNESGMVSVEHIQFSMLILKILGHEIHQRTPDFKGIEHFLRNRYNYWTYDIPHQDPFI